MTQRRPFRAPSPPMSDAHHQAITCELVRVTLGGRPNRPELEAPLVEPNPVRTRKPSKSRRNR